MGEPVQESDDGKQSEEGPPKNTAAKDTAEDVGAAPPTPVAEVPHLPWKRNRRRQAFEGDIAVAELRSQLALTPERIPEPAVPAPMFSGVLRLASGVAMIAIAVGAAGYLRGFKLSIEMPELTPASGPANVRPAPSARVASLASSNRDVGPPASRTAAIGVVPVGTRGAANAVTSIDAAQGTAPLPTPPRTVSPSLAPQPPAAGEDASLIAAKMKIGVELMTYGEVTAARVMFLRAAEAGDGAGAFALAETYDPLVLGGLRLREGIMPDVALARTWYERARDLGSLEARDRLARLVQLPQ